MEDKSVAIIGAGLFGLVTAKVLLRECNGAFDSVVLFEKRADLGGVWSTSCIYPGLASNSPALTYEIPGFQYPDEIRKPGKHVEADDINLYLRAFAQKYDLKSHISYNSLVRNVTWMNDLRCWNIQGENRDGSFEQHFKFLVVCNGMYHEKNIPAVAQVPSAMNGRVHHSSEIGDPQVREAVSNSRHCVVVGAGKSAIDLATLVASSKWSKHPDQDPKVTLVYKRPHWLSPRSMLRGTVYFERILFSRFVNSWLPFAKHPDAFHRWVAESTVGKWMTQMIFKFVADDFIKCCEQQDLPETIPDHSFKEALSGALHVVPNSYIELVRSQRIRIVEGRVADIGLENVKIRTPQGNLRLKAQCLIWATGYRVSFPFFSVDTLQKLGVLDEKGKNFDPNNLPFLKLHRLLVPPKTVRPNEESGPFRNIAFNGFAYSLLNPTISYVSAHWIAEYFLGHIEISSDRPIGNEMNEFYEWQKDTFAAHGKKGVHIGSHATLYADMLLADMGLQTGHVARWPLNPIRLALEWFRPMYPQIYAGLEMDKTEHTKEGSLHSWKGDTKKGPSNASTLDFEDLFYTLLLLVAALGLLFSLASRLM